jgi:hypothetical protein
VKDPRRLVTDTQTSELSRSLLAAGRARREPDGARERVWSSVALGLAGGAATTAATGRAATGTSAKGIVPALANVKLLVVGAVLVMAAVATAVAMNRDAPVAAARVVAVPVAARSQPTPEPVMEVPAQPAPVPVPPARVSGSPAAGNAPPASVKVSPAPPLVKASPVVDEPTQPPRPVAKSKLREEAALLQEARAALARGDTVTASAKLADARTRFPDSQLGEERDALFVRLARASGDHAHAAALARAFAEHYPESPLRAGVESIGHAPEKP